jgi:hypothetical protein
MAERLERGFTPPSYLVRTIISMTVTASHTSGICIGMVIGFTPETALVGS